MFTHGQEPCVFWAFLTPRTPHRRVKKKVRSVTSVHRTRDDLREGLIVQQMVVQEAMNEEEELWHRKRVGSQRFSLPRE